MDAAPIQPRPGGEFAHLDQDDFRRRFADPAHPGRVRFHLENVHCAGCLARIENVANEVEGVRHVRLDMGRHIAEVEVVPDGSLAAVADRFNAMGYPARPVQWDEAPAEADSENKAHLIRIGVSGACAGNIMLLTTSLYAGASHAEVAPAFEWLSFALFLPILLYGAVPFYRNSLAALRSRRASIDVPIAAAIVVGTTIGVFHLLTGAGDLYFDSLAVLVFLLLSSRYLLFQLQSRFLVPNRLRAFYEASAVRVLNTDTGTFEERHIGSVNAGDTVLVTRGNRMPVDGELLDEDAWVNSAVLTGEPHPQRVLKHQDVYAGTELTSESARVCVKTTGAGTRLGRLLEETERGVMARTPLISITDRVAQWFSVSVLVIAAAFALIYSTVDVREAINRGLALVILACPCALALATPLTQSLALRKAARGGCLIKKAEAFERLVQVRHAFFDKTGTLTQGELELHEWRPAPPTAREFGIVLALEADSQHPVARLLVAHAEGAGASERVHVSGREEIAGVGVRGDVGGDRYELRSLRAEDEGVSVAGNVHTIVGLYCNGELLKTAAFSDTVRASSRSAVARLQSHGIEAYLLTGDAEGPAVAVASEVGIDPANVRFRQTPEQKRDVIAAVPRSLMVGDGVNDAVALTAAHVSAAVHGSMEASFRAADVYLTQPGLAPLSDLVDLSHATIAIIKRNLLFSLFYNVTFGVLALMGFVSPLVAAVLMPISSVTVVLSSVIGNRFWRRFSRQPAGGILVPDARLVPGESRT